MYLLMLDKFRLKKLFFKIYVPKPNFISVNQIVCADIKCTCAVHFILLVITTDILNPVKCSIGGLLTARVT